MTENGASYLADVGTAFGNDYVRPLQCITPGSWETWCERIPRGMMNRSWLLAEVAQLHDCKDRNLSRIRVGAVSRGRLVFTTKRDRHSIVRVA